MKKQSRKLNLGRETLIPLTSGALDGINGGALPGPTGPATLTSGPSLPHTRMFHCDPMQTRFFCTQTGGPQQ